jgi:preprotein translocase subunit SecG
MLTVIIVIHLMLVLAMIGVVLLQKSEGGGLVSSGSGSGFLTGRGTANVLTRTTAMLAAGFFVTSLVLSWLAGFQRHPASIINSGGSETSREVPGAPPVPPVGQNGSLLDQLQRGIPSAPAAPGPAPGPEVPQSH